MLGTATSNTASLVDASSSSNLGILPAAAAAFNSDTSSSVTLQSTASETKLIYAQTTPSTAPPDPATTSATSSVSTALLTGFTSQEPSEIQSSTISTHSIAQSSISSISPTPSLESLTATSPGSSTIANPASLLPQQSPLPSQVSSASKSAVGPAIGGVFGSLAIIGLICFGLWLSKRRRKRGPTFEPWSKERRRSFIEIDNASLGPTNRTVKLMAQVGWYFDRQREQLSRAPSAVTAAVAAIKSKVRSKMSRNRDPAPSVGMNRGNSQYLDTQIPAHSRTVSALSEQTARVALRDKIVTLWERVLTNLNFKLISRGREQRSEDMFSIVAPRMTESPGVFSNYSVDAEDREDRIRSENHHSAHSADVLGLDMGNPFMDPTPQGANRFTALIAHPQPTASTSNVYARQLRRSRGLSVSTATGKHASRPPSNSSASRYPSIISEDNYRETMYSSYSTNVRRGKGRSDPFDLERPELLRAPPDQPTSDQRLTQERLIRQSATTSRVQTLQVNVHRPHIISPGRGNNKYGSGASGFSEWGGPGPDLGPPGEVGGSSLRVNTTSVSSGSIYVGLSADIRPGSPNSFDSRISNRVGQAM